MGVFVNNYYNIEDLYTSEKDKNSFDYLHKSVDYYITSLLKEKLHIKKARNLYDGRRDKEEFRYLEETFGIEAAIAVKMTPLIKTRIDVILGLLLDQEFSFTVSVSDTNTLDQVAAENRKKKAEAVVAAYKERMKKYVGKVRQTEGNPPKEEEEADNFVQKILDEIDENFISSFEIAAQSLITFFSQNPTIDLKQKVKQYFLDLLITGEAYYRTRVDKVGEDPIVEICKPENIFFSKNTSHQFLSSGHQPNVTAVVHRFYLKRSEILNRWGHLMNDMDKARIFGDYSEGQRRITSPRQLDYVYRRDAEGDDDIHNQHTNSNLDTLPCYHVEWLANNEIDLSENDINDLQIVEDSTVSDHFKDIYGEKAGSGKPKKKGYRLDRYEGLRIGEDIYLNMGKSKFPPRSEGKFWLTTLSYNGIAYNDRNGKPYSLPLALKDLQDSFDIINFFRDNLIANAGVDGSRINLAAIPKVLGNDYMERLLKFLAFRKQGIELYDPTEDGANLFNHYGDFKGSLTGNLIEQLASVLESIERQADIVSGINRHMYQAAEVRDAATNVKLGQQQVSLITKDIFELLDTSRIHMLTDLLNIGKLTYVKGKRGSYIVGTRQMLFEVKPESFCFSDFNINVLNSSKELLKVEKVKQLIPELVAAGMVEPDVAIKVTMSDSPSEILHVVNASLAKKAKENSAMSQMRQQLEQLSGQIKQYETELQKSAKEVEALTKASDELKVRDLEMREKESQERLRQSQKRLELDTQLGLREMKKDEEVVRLEREQIYAENAKGSSREVRNDL